MSDMTFFSYLFRCLKLLPPAEVFREMLHRAIDRERCHAAKGAQRSQPHRFRKVGHQSEILLNLDAVPELIRRSHATGGSNAAGSACSAALDRTELHGETRHF